MRADDEILLAMGRTWDDPRQIPFDTDPDPPHLGHLTICAWQAVQHCLDGNEATAQAIFDEINATLEEVDRMNFPREEAFQRRLVALETEGKGLRNRLANSEASLCQIRVLLAQADDKHVQLQTSRDEIARLLEAAEIKSKLANDQISSLNNVVEGLNGRICSMLASRSWRITAPLRVLQRWIFGR